MNEQAINEQYQHILNLIRSKRLKEALAQLTSMLWNCSDWELRARLEQMETSYSYMLQYMRRGVHDPERAKLYQNLIADTWEIADHARLRMLDHVSFEHYHLVRRTRETEEPDKRDIRKLTHILESFQDDLAVARFLSTDQQTEVLERHEQTLKSMFLQTWTLHAWTVKEEEEAQAMLTSEHLPINDLCLFVSALTLSLIKCFDVRKMLWLLDAYQASSDHMVKQRALIGWIIALHLHKERVALYPELIAKVEIYEENATFSKDTNSIYKQLLLCQETEKIDKKMREEIIPEMIKSASSMRNMKFGFEESEEESNDMNPDWINKLENPELENKLREMTELQLEGADVYMSTFAALKGYPFFREVHNWFYPFDKQHSSVISLLNKDKENNNILDLILNSGTFSNSDKYSMFFTVQQLPEAQREMMFSQLSEQQMNEISELSDSRQVIKQNETAETVSNQYLHDLYRFFKLYTRRNEFHDFFKDKLALHRLPILDKLLYCESSMMPIAHFYLAKERWSEAAELFKEIEKIGNKELNPELYQKIGYTLQKEKKYEDAIEAYLKADAIKPNNIWTNAHLATTYRLNRNYKEAIDYYKKVEEIEPENRVCIFHTASCLAETGRHEEALNYFYKLDFMEENSTKAWRGIGWCSFVSKKYEQAMRYYTKIIERKPLSIDYMNAGHVAWVLGNLDSAVTLYEKAIQKSGDKELFLEMFHKDEEQLVKQGIPRTDIPLMLDLLDSSSTF